MVEGNQDICREHNGKNDDPNFKQLTGTCSTGIFELDQKLGGGLPAGSTVLLVGSSGSGKTTLCMEFLANGAKIGDRGVFFTITEPLFLSLIHI